MTTLQLSSSVEHKRRDFEIQSDTGLYILSLFGKKIHIFQNILLIRIKVIQVQKHTRVSKQQQNHDVWVDYPFKSMRKEEKKEA